ncbi:MULTISPECIES: hypothetical protein [Bradyrhizobium]|uniref:Uncharacterized protein n=1 Tax=Bradyrhizobium brasilense TaxID=1419277 RepID=A0ABY8JIN4_9BRAD|nr:MULTISPECIES: hypothetical protein [Bradyrhizobium]MCP1830309.1 hypothetical protein [Bradyrhizobium sp. USDA 4545]MCP1923418.1 hypothetical protein [Bradyrhizobium sp. USDA 4532]WFU65440.1 hypothetical protein QA636_07920 [Bradyrhizobium brasilense]
MHANDAFVAELEMANAITLRTAIDIAWSVFCATHSGIDTSDRRRCLLERHLYGSWDRREGDAEDLASFGLAYLSQLSEDEH